MSLESRRKATAKWKLKNPDYNPNWWKNHPEYAKQAYKKFIQSEKGKQSDKKRKAKRKRNMNWILMFPNPFDDSVSIEYHHITNAYVVAIPKDLHQLYNGKYHRENLMEIIKQIYLEK